MRSNLLSVEPADQPRVVLHTNGCLDAAAPACASNLATARPIEMLRCVMDVKMSRPLVLCLHVFITTPKMLASKPSAGHSNFH